MSTLRVAAPTGDPEVDRVVRGFLAVVGLLFPERMRSCYLTGSWCDGTAVRRPGDSLNSSDVDLLVVFKEGATPSEVDRFEATRQACEEISALGLDGLDATATDELRLFREGHLPLKEASLLLAGDDIRDAVPLPRLGAYLQRAVTLSIELIGTFRAAQHLSVPLTYPDPHGEFYGYDYGEAAYGDLAGTRILVDSITWAAAATLALRAGRCAGSKRAAVTLYGTVIADGWAALVQDIYTRCKATWRYGIPREESERRELRHLCGQVLDFEMHMLDLYRVYLQQAVDADEEHVRAWATGLLARIGVR